MPFLPPPLLLCCRRGNPRLRIRRFLRRRRLKDSGLQIRAPRGPQEKIQVPEEVNGLVAEVMLAPEMSAALSMNGMLGDCHPEGADGPC